MVLFTGRQSGATVPTAGTAKERVCTLANASCSPPGSGENIAGSSVACRGATVSEAIESVAAADPNDLERLGEEIAELAGHLHAATYRLLVCLREFDRRSGWGSGFRNCAHWLSWRTGIGLGAAREKVRVAHALAELPLLSEAMRQGELSFAKVRAVTRIVTPDNEERLLEFARCATASQLERVVRAWRRVDRATEQADERERHFARELCLYVDDDGMYVLRGRLDPEVGAVLVRALAAAVAVLYGRAARNDTSIEQRRADAIGLIAEAALRTGVTPEPTPDAIAAAGKMEERVENDAAAENTIARADQPAPARRTVTRADRFQVVMHVDADGLRESSETGQSVLDGGVRVSAETSRRLACDASRVVMRHASDGSVLDVSRRTRIVPTPIRRALEARDRGCRFPGCGLRHCDAHHVRHWADGGKTRLDNLVLLCRRHHRLVHEDGWRIETAPDGEIRFHRPDGRLMPMAPSLPRLSAEPVTALAAAHEEAGVTISAETVEPFRSGERLDMDFAILTLRRACAPGGVI